MGAIHGCDTSSAIEYIGHDIFNIHVFVTFSSYEIFLYGLSNHFHIFKYHVFSSFCRNFTLRSIEFINLLLATLVDIFYLFLVKYVNLKLYLVFSSLLVVPIFYSY